jgi:hypothetical protein
MERLSETDFIIHGQPWLMARALRAVLREDPAVVRCTAHHVGTTAWRLHIEADYPLICLQNALQNIKAGILAAGLAGNTRSAQLSVAHH